MKIVRATLGDDIDDAAYRPSELCTVTAVDHAEFAHAFLRRGVFLGAGGGGDIVSAVYGNKVVVYILAGKGKLGHRLDDHVRAAGGRVADLHSGC